MSYRDLRNFTEMMRALGYNRLVSMENFRSPNFPLVSDMLVWLVKRFDPDADVHELTGTEEDRVLLVRSVAEFMAIKGSIMLNTKRIYQADGFAVKELLKISTLLYDALRNNENGERSKSTWTSSSAIEISSYIEELKMSRELATQVTTKGASIFELLGKEIDLRDVRNSCVNNMLELNRVESGLKEAIAHAKDEITNMKMMITNVSATESSLDVKIEKKQTELERNQKRLMTLKKVRPAFLEEFEKLEIELQALYQEYIVRTRCMAFLEQQQEEAIQAEHDRMQRRQKETQKLMEELQLEDARRIMENDMALEGPNLGMGGNPEKMTRRLRTATASKMRLATGKKRVFGSMTAHDEDDSIDSDSDLLLDDDDGNSEYLGSGDDLEGLPLESKSEPSDDDF